MALYTRTEQKNGKTIHVLYGRLGRGRKARSITRHYETAAELEQARALFEAEVALGYHAAEPDESMTLEAYLRGPWWKDHVKGGKNGRPLAANTVDDYDKRLRKWVLPYLGGYTLAELDDGYEIAEAWLDWMRDEGAQPPTVEKTKQMLSGAVGKARRYGVRTNPFADLESGYDSLIDHLEPAPSPLMVERLRWLFLLDHEREWWRRVRNASLTDVLYGLGLRQQEAFALSWPTVLVAGGGLADTWYLHESLSGRELRKGKMKSKAGLRHVQVFEVVLERLEIWWHLLGRPRSGLVYGTSRGTPEHRQNFRQDHWQRAFFRAEKLGFYERGLVLHPTEGVHYYKPHTLRHVATDILVEAHWSESDVMDQLGWGERRMLERYRQRVKTRGKTPRTPDEQIREAAAQARAEIEALPWKLLADRLPDGVL